MMRRALKTRHVFLDTQVFKSANFNYQSTRFQELISLARAGRIFVYLTEITIREIQSNVSEDMQSASRKLKNIQSEKELRILKNLNERFIEILFSPFDSEAAMAALFTQFTRFQKDVQVSLIPIQDTSVSEVFDKYFARLPPFGEGKKKEEFPDAFVVNALQKWCARNNRKIYVISGDEDMKSACRTDERLLSLNKLEELLDLVSKDDEQLYPLLRNLFDENIDEVTQKIEARFGELGFVTYDSKAEVTGVVSVNSVQIKEVLLVKVDANKTLLDDQAVFDITAEVNFSAEVVISDPDSSTYGSEEEIIESTTEVSIEVSASFSLDDIPYFRVEKMSFTDSDVYIELEDY
jgi:hypothetical protein